MIGFVAALVLSQAPCASNEAALRSPGWWQKRHDEVLNADPTFPKAKWPPLLAHSDQLLEMLQKALPAPAGVSLSPTRVLPGKSMLPEGAVPHGVEVPVFDVSCVDGKQKPYDETGTWIYIQFNTLSWLDNERMQTGLVTKSGATILRVPHHTEELHGSPVFTPRINADRADEAVVFTRDGSSPYKLISQSTYLEARIRKQEAFNDDVRKRGAKVQPKYLDELDGQKRSLEQALSALSEDEHHKAAIVKDFNALPPAALFTTLEAGGHKLATMERKHFEPGGPRDGRMFVTAYWSFDEKKETNVAVVRQLKEKFDWEALKKMVQR
jgi:hypothetical protein